MKHLHQRPLLKRPTMTSFSLPIIRIPSNIIISAGILKKHQIPFSY
ncbi:hypothetical protein EH5_01778 [Bacillus subtilis]|nr:hypothetical protein EH5_01778 [Bacillus subtilis]